MNKVLFRSVIGIAAALMTMSCGGAGEKAAIPSIGAALSKAEKIASGEKTYAATCIACHQATGLGLPNLFPPLAGSDYLKDKVKTIQTITRGLTGEVVVSGAKYNSVMPPVKLSDGEVANVLTYVYNCWGNDGSEFTAEEVAKSR